MHFKPKRPEKMTLGSLKLDRTVQVDSRPTGGSPFGKAFEQLRQDQNGLVDALFAIREKASEDEAA